MPAQCAHEDPVKALEQLGHVALDHWNVHHFSPIWGISRGSHCLALMTDTHNTDWHHPAAARTTCFTEIELRVREKQLDLNSATSELQDMQEELKRNEKGT